MMLVPAILYANEIREKIARYNYSDDMLYYSGYIGNFLPTISDDNDGSHYQYAIVDNNKFNDKLIGYFEYKINWYSSCAHCFGLFSFDRKNKIIGFDVFREMKKIINDYHIHRIEWRMVSGNPVEKHYDRFCKRYNGNKFVLTDAIKDRCCNYHNAVIYEIIFDERNDKNA